jgi:hypothetical protein
MAKCILFFYIIVGKVERSDNLYTIHTDGKTYEHACEGETLNWIVTGEFIYDDFKCECNEIN